MNNKSTWDEIARIWKRIAAVITAMGVGATFFIKVFNSPTDRTIMIASVLGIVLLIISFYVDNQTKYIREEIKDSKKETDNKLLAHQQESTKIVSNIHDSLNELKNLSLDTRKDTLRIQLLIVMRGQPDNIDTILRLAETYFVKLKGDWYMTNEFNKWAKKHDVIIPQNIFNAINTNNDH